MNYIKIVPLAVSEVPVADGLVLLDARPDHVAAFNAAKAAHKLCEEKKTCISSMWEAHVKDNETILKHVLQHSSDEDQKKALVDLAARTVVVNAGVGIDGDGTHTHAQSAAAGWFSAQEICKIEKGLLENQKSECNVIDHFFKYVKNEKKKKQILEGVEKRREYHDQIRQKYFDTFLPGNGCDPSKKGKILNKPEWNYTKFRGGSICEADALTCTFIDHRQIENDPNFVFNTISKYKKWIVFSVLTSLGVYLIFKNRKKFRSFLGKIKKVIKRPLQILNQIRNCRLINNRFTRSIWVIVSHNIKTC